jgi:outer membrane protein assembly factor BamA
MGAQQVTQIPLDTLGKKVVTDVIIEGNKKTRERIILRELTISIGDSLFWSNLQAGMRQSENNIMNLGLFNFVEIEPIQVNNQEVILLIDVQERWYIYPSPILQIAQTNFNTWWETKELRWLNYGFRLDHNNFRGRNERLSLTLRFGYTKRFSASYTIPNLNKKQTLGLHLSAGFFENNEIVYNTANNERLFYRNDEDKARQYYQYKVGLSYRENIFLRHYFEISYLDASVQDTVLILQPNYFEGGVSRSRFLRATYLLNYDTRDYRRYPLKGLRLQGVFQQDGLGLVNEEGLALFTTSVEYSHHFKLGKRTYWAHSLTGKANLDRAPYYLTQGLGYSRFVRGYEFYVIDGFRRALLRSNFKVEVIKPTSVQIPFVPTDKFSRTFFAVYANLFFDAGYVDGSEFQPRNSLVNEYLYSFGAGVDVVTYYDKVMRIEASLNGLGETHIFFHFKQAF